MLALGTTEQQIIFPDGLTTTKSLSTDTLIAKSNFHVATKMKAINIDAKDVISPKISAVELTTRRLAPGKSGKIRIEGKLRISGAVAYTSPTIDLAASPFSSSFLEQEVTTTQKTSLDGPHQPWRRISYDTFDGHANDWHIENQKNTTDTDTDADTDIDTEMKTLTKLSHCGDGNMFLGGHCNAGGGHVLRRTWDVAPHSEVRIVARVHLIDSWEGEIAWMKVDGYYVWTTTGRSSIDASHISMCGDEKMNDAQMSTLVDVVIPHASKNVEITFGTSLDEHACNESIGIDDVEIFIH